MISRAKMWAKSIKRDAITLWLAARDPRTPWYAKVLAGLVAAYALSPIDLIPDFIPIIGYLDDLLILPLGILAVVALIPVPLMEEFRAKASQISEYPVSRRAAAVIIAIWMVFVASLLVLFREYWSDLRG